MIHAPIYVDRAIHSWRGKKWCHLFSEDLVALHAFAAGLGLRRSWFQEPPRASWPHYDVTEGKREQALRTGAVEADHFTTLEIAWRLTGTLTAKRQAKLARLRAKAAA